MASIDELFNDDDDVIVDGSYQEPQNLEDEKESLYEEEDVITTLLKRLGIVDPNKIKFEDESGEVEERAWDDLSYEELLNILTTNEASTEESEDDLDDDEIDLINSVRLANITPLEYLQQVKEQAIQEYLLSNGNIAEPTYTVDDYTDDELFLYDMLVRMPDLTEDELTQALESAKANEVVFNKQINGLRAEYKKLEENKLQQEQLIAQQLQQELYNQYANTILEGINNLDDIAGTFELEEEDKQMIAQFILGHDLAGISLLGKAINDPQTLIEMSWFALKGREAIDSINEYYKELITKAREAGYAKGLEAAKKGSSSTSKVAVKPGKSKLIKKDSPSIEDLFD